MKPDYQDIINILQNQHDMLLVGHEYPDGDCLGSVLALYEIFGGAEKNWQMLVHDEIPKNLRFLPLISASGRFLRNGLISMSPELSF